MKKFPVYLNVNMGIAGIVRIRIGTIEADMWWSAHTSRHDRGFHPDCYVANEDGNSKSDIQQLSA